MLDINDPQTKIIFQASAFTDKLKDACKKYSTENFEERQYSFMEMKIICEEFIEFCKKNYAIHVEILYLMVNEIVQEIEVLEILNNQTEEGKCKVCNGELYSYKSFVSESEYSQYCTKCSRKIFDLIFEIEKETGAIFI